MSKLKRVTLVVISLAVLLSVFALSVFADAGSRLPVSKNIPSATAVIQRTGGITQTPSAFAGNPYSTQYLYSGGNADTSVKLVVYSDDAYIDNYGWTGVKSIHYVFTSKVAFDFNIDFGNVPAQLLEEYLPDELTNVEFPTAMAISVRTGLAENINSNGLPYTFHDADNISTHIFVNTHNSTGDYFAEASNYFTEAYEHIDYFTGDDSMLAINSVTGSVNYDNGNLYNFVDVRLCIQASNEEYGHFIPGITSCDALNSKYLDALATYSAGNGYDIGYVDGSYDGFENGYETGYDEGYDYGFDVGYDDGSVNAIDNMGIFSVFTKSIDALMDFPIFDLPNGDTISLGLLFGVIVGAMAFVWLLKLVAGG